jgi:iron complex outermembrane receptor protein
LSESVWFRGSAFYDHEDGYIENITDGEDLGGYETFNLRGALRFTEFMGGELQLTGWGERSTDDGFIYKNLIESVDSDPFGAVESDLNPEEDYNIFGAVARYERGLGAGTILSTTSVVGYEVDYIEDFDGTSSFYYNYAQNEEEYLASHELRYISDESGAFRWFAGGMVYREQVGSTFTQSYDDGDLCYFYELDDAAVCDTYFGQTTDTLIFADADNKGAAVYGEAVFDLSNSLSVTGGIRFTVDEREFTINSPVPGGNLDPDDVGYIVPTDGLDVTRSESYTSVQPRLALNFIPNDNLAVYGVISNGVKPGGFDTFDPFSPAFDVETLWNYEVGARGSLANKDINWAFSGYVYDYNDLQVGTYDGTRLIIGNAGQASGVGIEGEIKAQATDFLFLRFAGAWSDTKYDTFIDADGNDFSGNKLIYSPELSFNAMIDLRKAVPTGHELFTQLYTNYQSEQFFAPSNLQFESQSSLTLMDLRLGVKSPTGNWTVSAYAENLTDEQYNGLAEDTNYDENFGQYVSLRGRPRTFGVRLDWSLD